jgi:hypothetical protein
MLADQPLDVPITRIGVFVEGSALWYVDGKGRRQELPPTGYAH